jgi:NAD-dependent SIR2 family protein deacetylase
MVFPLELHYYCQACGNELDSEARMDPKQINELRIDITPCKTCEKNRVKESAAPIVLHPADVLFKKKRRSMDSHARKKPIVLENLSNSPRKRGRPRKNPVT